MANKQDIAELKEIKDEMQELLDRATRIIRHTGDRHIFERAKAYWIGHIATGLGHDSEYVTSPSDHTLEDTIKELEAFVDEDEDGAYDSDGTEDDE